MLVQKGSIFRTVASRRLAELLELGYVEVKGSVAAGSKKRATVKTTGKGGGGT